MLTGRIKSDNGLNLLINYESKKIVMNKDKGIIIKKIMLESYSFPETEDADIEILTAERIRFVDDESNEFVVSTSDIFFVINDGKNNMDLVLKRVDLNVQ